jgi:HAD superfamily hydrolase (TIGR01509 family)
MLDALLWDVDGTLAETERDGHLVAFNQAFELLKLPWRWSEKRYGELLAVTGGRERLLHDLQSQGSAPEDPRARHELVERVHALKNRVYAEIVAAGHLPLRDGVAELLEDCRRAGVRMGIVTTTSRANVDALLTAHCGLGWESLFATVVCAEQAPRKKPDPQAYDLALAALNLQGRDAVAIEDAPAGVAAARAAGVAALVTRSHYFTVAAQGALAAGASLAEPGGWWPRAEAASSRIDLRQIARWHAQGVCGVEHAH